MESWDLPLNIVEKQDEIVVKATLPEIEPEKIDVTVENDVLTIRGATESEHEEKQEEGNMSSVSGSPVRSTGRSGCRMPSTPSRRNRATARAS